MRVLVLHDAGGQVRGAPVWQRLGAGHDVVELDLPGYGRTPLPPAGADLVWVVGWLGAQLDALDWTDALVVGTSLGGWFALELAAAAPDRVTGLVLCAPAGLQVPADYLLRLFVLGVPTVEAAPAHRVAAAAHGSFHPALADPGTLARAARVRCPTTILHGAADTLIPPAHARAYAAIPGARLDVLPGIGHLVALEAPQRVVAAVEHTRS